MQQRQLRLGDILDDYCPRERRLSNHTIVAMVGDEIRLTRCTTCDAEHPYKGGKAPRLRRKKSTVEAAYDEVLDSVKHDAPQGILVTHPAPAAADQEMHEDDRSPAVPEPNSNGDAPALAESSEPEEADVNGAPDEVRLHRPLIRAQLPRLEKEPTPRPVPEFTIRQANKRHGRFQSSRPGRFAKSGHGNTRGGHPGGRPQGQGSRPGRHRDQNKKRSR